MKYKALRLTPERIEQILSAADDDLSAADVRRLLIDGALEDGLEIDVRVDILPHPTVH
jgi:hypothetical protein